MGMMVLIVGGSLLFGLYIMYQIFTDQPIQFLATFGGAVLFFISSYYIGDYLDQIFEDKHKKSS